MKTVKKTSKTNPLKPTPKASSRSDSSKMSKVDSGVGLKSSGKASKASSGTKSKNLGKASKAGSGTKSKNLGKASKASSNTKSKSLRPFLRGAATALALMLWVWAAVIASQLVVEYIMVSIVGEEEILQPVPYAIHSALSYTLTLVLIILVPVMAARTRRNLKTTESIDGPSKQAPLITKTEITAGRERLGLRGLPTWTDIGLAPVGFVIYLVLAMALTYVFSVFPWFDLDEVQEIGFSLTVSGSDRVVAFLTLVVVAPIAEEIIFRGWLYEKLRDNALKRLSMAWRIGWSVFLTSLLFGILHQQWNVGVSVFALSVVLCGLREFTGTIYAGILLHMLKNGIAFYSLFVAGIG